MSTEAPVQAVNAVEPQAAAETPNRKRGMAWLLFAVAFEVFGTTCLKLCDGFTVLLPSVAFVIAYSICMVCMVMSLRDLPLGFMYGIWGGVGSIATTVIGIVIWHDPFTFVIAAGLALVIGGIYLLNRGSDELDANG